MVQLELTTALGITCVNVVLLLVVTYLFLTNAWSAVSWEWARVRNTAGRGGARIDEQQEDDDVRSMGRSSSIKLGSVRQRTPGGGRY